jgi:hypothetical protein
MDTIDEQTFNFILLQKNLQSVGLYNVKDYTMHASQAEAELKRYSNMPTHHRGTATPHSPSSN